jgi:subtilisin family serine protease
MAISARVLLVGPMLALLPFGFATSATPVDADDLVPDQVVARFSHALPADVEALVAPVGEVVLRSDELTFVSVRTDPARVPEALAHLAALPGVVEAYQARYVRAHFTPNDAFYSQQWGPAVIGMEQAWNSGLGSHAVKVAVLDTGINYAHHDLMANTMLGDANCGPDLNLWGGGPLAVDDNSHGSHVAGTVAAVTNNALGVAGMSQACIQSIKVLSAIGAGTWEQLAVGILWAAQTGAHIISMSLGGSGANFLVESALLSAWNQGVLLIASAGNSGCPSPTASDTVGFPARNPHVVAIANLNSATTVSSTSSCGPTVELAAPGTNILSTCHIAFGYCTKSGTSMAAPHVSGVAALVKHHNPALTNDQLRCLLRATADDLGPAGHDRQFGHGRVDAASAVAAATNPASVGC